MTHALYYPTIEFADLNCLKRSLLVWDRVFRIVPRGYAPNDTDDIKAAVSEGAIVNLTLEQDEKSAAAQHFLDLYEKLNSPTNRLVWPAGFSTSTFTNINPEKIDAKLLPLFEQLSKRLTDDGFLEVPHELAGGYMFYLANSVAANRSLDLLSDSPDYWTVGTFFANAANFTEQVYDESAQTYLATLAVEDLLPKTLEGLTIDALLRFRNEHIEERQLFQTELTALRSEISRCNSRKHANYIVQDFIKRFEQSKKDYKSAFKKFSKAEVYTMLTVGLPATMGFLSLPVVGGSDPYAALRIGVGTLIGAVSSLAARKLIPKERSVSSYLVSAEDMASGPGYALHRRFEEFIND